MLRRINWGQGSQWCSTVILSVHALPLMKDVPMNSVQAAGFPFANTDLTKAWFNFGLPSLNIGALREAHRKNAAAVTSANQVILDGLKTLAQCQGELFKTTVDDYSK